MAENRGNGNELEEKLRAFFHDQDREIDPPMDFRERLSPQLGEQRGSGLENISPAFSLPSFAFSHALVAVLAI